MNMSFLWIRCYMISPLARSLEREATEMVYVRKQRHNKYESKNSESAQLHACLTPQGGLQEQESTLANTTHVLIVG